jgi:hypothetical protein
VSQFLLGTKILQMHTQEAIAPHLATDLNSSQLTQTHPMQASRGTHQEGKGCCKRWPARSCRCRCPRDKAIAALSHNMTPVHTPGCQCGPPQCPRSQAESSAQRARGWALHSSQGNTCEAHNTASPTCITVPST